MSKSVLAIHRELEKQKPLYRAMKKLHDWYVAHPHTVGVVATKIQQLHDRVEAEQSAMQERHAAELLPLMKVIEEANQTVKDAQAKAKPLGLKHRQEKEDITMAFAVAEIQLLEGKITEVPDELKPIDSRAGPALSFGIRAAKWLRGKFPGVVNTNASA